MQKGCFIIISGPSGAGKTSLCQMLLKSKLFRNKIVKSVSATTRPKRPGERNGKEYFFITEQMFLYKKKKGHFLESKKVFNYFYGTPKKQVEEQLRKGKNVLLSIDVKGSRTVCRKYGDVLKIFVKTPSLIELYKRLKHRATENFKDRAIRLRTAKKELSEAKYYDYIIVNDVLPKAYNNLKTILLAELLKRKGKKQTGCCFLKD